MLCKLYFKQSLEDSNIDYLRFRSQPTILNNVLWYSIIETDNNSTCILFNF